MSLSDKKITKECQELKETINNSSENKQLILNDLRIGIKKLNRICEDLLSQENKNTLVNLKDIANDLIIKIAKERTKLHHLLAKENEGFENISFFCNEILLDRDLVEFYNLSKMQGRLKAFLLGKKLLYKDLKSIVKLNPFVENLFDSYFEELLKVEN
jgi:hypothetical protein